MLRSLAAIPGTVIGLIVFGMIAGLYWLGFTDSLPANVTCQGLRSLRVGMSYADVRRSLGDPFAIVPSDSIPADLDRPDLWPESAGRTWDYSKRQSPAGGLCFKVEFREGRLVEAEVYVKTFGEDMGKWVFLLDDGGIRETPRLQREVCQAGSTPPLRYMLRRFGAAGVVFAITALIVAVRRRKAAARPAQ